MSSATGEPPYTVRWLDTGRTAFVYPGPDAVVLSADALADADRRADERFARVQTAIGSRGA